MSRALIESFESDFTPEKFSDEYQAQLRQLIDAKLEKGDSVSTEETFGESADDSGEGGAGEGGAGQVLDLMEALRRSVDKSRESKKPAATKTAAAKPAATKTGAAKPAAKKPTAKKPAAAKAAPAKKTG